MLDSPVPKLKKLARLKFTLNSYFLVKYFTCFGCVLGKRTAYCLIKGTEIIYHLIRCKFSVKPPSNPRLVSYASPVSTFCFVNFRVHQNQLSHTLIPIKSKELIIHFISASNDCSDSTTNNHSSLNNSKGFRLFGTFNHKSNDRNVRKQTKNNK